MTAPHENGNGKRLGVVLAIIGGAVGLAALFLAVKQGGDNLLHEQFAGIQRQIDELKIGLDRMDVRSMARHDDAVFQVNRLDAPAQLSAIKVQFVEVETQFRALGARVLRNETSLDTLCPAVVRLQAIADK